MWRARIRAADSHAPRAGCPRRSLGPPKPRLEISVGTAALVACAVSSACAVETSTSNQGLDFRGDEALCGHQLPPGTCVAPGYDNYPGLPITCPAMEIRYQDGSYVADQEAYRAAIGQFRVDCNPRYQALDGGASTYCNIFMWDVSVALGFPIPHWVTVGSELPDEPHLAPHYRGPRSFELRVNHTIDWLMRHDGDPAYHAWTRLTTRTTIAAGPDHLDDCLSEVAAVAFPDAPLVEDDRSPAAVAQEWANRGVPVLAVYKNQPSDRCTNEYGVGHAAWVVPADGSYDPKVGPWVAQAGIDNFDVTAPTTMAQGFFGGSAPSPVATVSDSYASFQEYRSAAERRLATLMGEVRFFVPVPLLSTQQTEISPAGGEGISPRADEIAGSSSDGNGME